MIGNYPNAPAPSHILDDRRDIAYIGGLFVKSHIVRTITLAIKTPLQDAAVQVTPEVIHTGRRRDTAYRPTSVAMARAAVDILLHQPELPGPARARTRTRLAPVGRPIPRLTTRVEVSSDDLAVIRHALTAVAEVKVSA